MAYKRINVDVNKILWQKLKAKAAMYDRTLIEELELALRKYLYLMDDVSGGDKRKCSI